MHIFVFNMFFYHISATRFGVVHTPSSGRISYYSHNTFCCLLCAVCVTLGVLCAVYCVLCVSHWVCCVLSTVCCVCHIGCAVCCVCHIGCAVCCLLCAVCHIGCAVCCLLCAVCVTLGVLCSTGHTVCRYTTFCTVIKRYFTLMWPTVHRNKFLCNKTN
jgi:hypothetical protein